MMHPDGKEMEIIARLMEEKKLQVRIDKIFSLNQIPWAHEAIETHKTDGKIIVKIE